MNQEQAFAQGARCGHIEGKGRAGQYVVGEEIELAWDATVNQGFKSDMIGLVSQAWEQGYQHGYRRAAEGSELEPQYRLYTAFPAGVVIF